MKLTRATAAECEAMAAAHLRAFHDKAWRDDEFEDLLEGEGIFGFLAEHEAPLGIGSMAWVYRGQHISLQRPVVLKVLPDYYDIISGSVKTSNVYDAILIHIHPDLMPDWQRVVKRTVDIVASLFALILLSPLMLFAAVMVLLSSKGPIIYRQERIGRFGRPFNIYKFRSMFVGSEVQGNRKVVYRDIAFE